MFLLFFIFFFFDGPKCYILYFFTRVVFIVENALTVEVLGGFGFGFEQVCHK